ncbi:alpha/beta hydrolase [Stakelama sp. CBK3Z-3]|uniref:Alpha/beta hydrolase n=1 Tax=Stakelama flava TaxID=2860338 RepID=A0ABS6XPX9_9SPHN|nr:alpha/beta hydrolase [Stakelama flava]MBW4331939.1 alpha/beta hydrolase [Stakelama flava]
MPLFRRSFLVALALILAPAGARAQGTDERPITFETIDHHSVAAFEGTFAVPENRADPDSRTLTLHYVRFPATSDRPGAPIVYLAGGPGGSGINTAKGDRFALFMALRRFGDVIALDQRGTGASNDVPECVSHIAVPDDHSVGEAELTGYYRKATAECAAFWRDRGVDPLGYTTAQSVADLDALRRHLGVDRITLWGISYGTHLALAAMREMAGHLDRVILASAEGLSQTVKLPARTDAYFSRLQAAINTVPAAKALYPDIAALIRRVNARLRDHPQTLHLSQKDGGVSDVVLNADSMQRMAAAMIADPGSAAAMLALYRSIDAGEFGPVTMVVARYFHSGGPIRLDAMPLVMDIASGIDDDRLALVDAQARHALLGRYLNFPMPQLNGALPGADLGPAFRKPPESDVRTLLLTGTLDGRTYPDAHRAATSGLTHVDHVTIVNAGHNLFMVSPEVTNTITDWMAGGDVDGRRITIALPDFVNPMP